MPQPSLLDEDWDDLLCAEKLILEYELTPRDAIKRVLEERHHLEVVPHTKAWSRLKRLEKYERKHRGELRLAVGPVKRTRVQTISVGTAQKVTYRITDLLRRLIRRSR